MGLCMGVDQSYKSCGIVIVDETGDIKLADIFRTEGEDMFDRAWAIAQHISVLATDHNVDHITLEGLSFSNFGNATRDLAGLQYTIVTILRFADKKAVNIVPPMTLKKFATTKGNATKQEMVDNLPETVLDYFKSCGFKKTTGLYDITDAYFLSKYPVDQNRRDQLSYKEKKPKEKGQT